MRSLRTSLGNTPELLSETSCALGVSDSCDPCTAWQRKTWLLGDDPQHLYHFHQTELQVIYGLYGEYPPPREGCLGRGMPRGKCCWWVYIFSELAWGKFRPKSNHCPSPSNRGFIFTRALFYRRMELGNASVLTAEALCTRGTYG